MIPTNRKIPRKQVLFPALLLVFCWILPHPCTAAEKHFTNSHGMEFVMIPSGEFHMGSPSREPHRNRDEAVHRVVLSKPFYMQITEVTVEQWRSVMGWKLFGRKRGKKNAPVVRVSWFDCQDFIEKLNEKGDGTYRLPTEAEWEYACRAGTSTAYSWGDKTDCSKAMFSNNSLKSDQCMKVYARKGFPENGPAPVKSFAPNPWGLYDMHGNVWEWCRDWYGPYPAGTVTDPSGVQSDGERVRRGGSWFKYGWYCRSANRNKGHPAIRHDTLGFRVIREIR